MRIVSLIVKEFTGVSKSHSSPVSMDIISIYTLGKNVLCSGGRYEVVNDISYHNGRYFIFTATTIISHREEQEIKLEFGNYEIQAGNTQHKSR